MGRLPLLVVIFLTAAPAAAQDPIPAPLPPEPMTPFVVDARGTWARLTQEPTVAADLGVDLTDLPNRGLGFVVGAHVYPIRGRGFAIGVGGEMLRVRGSHTIEPETEEGESGPTLKTRWDHLSPQVSFNFGSRHGWSYLTVGLGRSSLTMERDDEPQEDPASKVRTLNYGGGARWFAKKRVAFTLDLRFYSINAQDAAAGRIATPKMRLMVFSGGISIR